jgi:hypothetical protein
MIDDSYSSIFSASIMFVWLGVLYRRTECGTYAASACLSTVGSPETEMVADPFSTCRNCTRASKVQRCDLGLGWHGPVQHILQVDITMNCMQHKTILAASSLKVALEISTYERVPSNFPETVRF